MPSTGATVELRSLIRQSRDFVATPSMAEPEIHSVARMIAEEFVAAPLPPEFGSDSTEASLFLSDGRIMKVFLELTRGSTPGLPYAKCASQKLQLITNCPDELCEHVRNRMILLCHTDVAEVDDMTAEELVDQGFCDPVRMFIKNDAHKLTKLEDNRERLIASVSIIDEICERIAYTDQINLDKKHWRTCPSKIGFGSNLEDGVVDLYNSINNVCPVTECQSNDIEHFDFSCSRNESDVFVAVKFAQADMVGNGSLSYRNFVRNRDICAFRSVIATSDGQLYKMVHDSYQKSGRFATGHANNIMRNGLSKRAGSLKVFTMGDDAVEQGLDDKIPKYAEMGFKLKSVRKCDDGQFEFCSALIGPDSYQPLNIVKATYNLLRKKYDLSLYEAFKAEYQRSSEYDHMMEVISQTGWVCENAAC